MLGYVLEKVENGFNNYLSSSLSSSCPTLGFHRGMDVVEKDGPLIITMAETLSPVEGADNLGVYAVGTRVWYKHPYEDTGSYATRMQYVNSMSYALLNNNNINTDLENQTNNLTIHATYFNGMTNQIEGDSWICEMQFNVICRHTSAA